MAAASSRYATVGLSVGALATDVAVGLAETALTGCVPFVRTQTSEVFPTALGRSGTTPLGVPAVEAYAPTGSPVPSVEASVVKATAVAGLVPGADATTILRGAEGPSPASSAIGPASGGATTIATATMGSGAEVPVRVPTGVPGAGALLGFGLLSLSATAQVGRRVVPTIGTTRAAGAVAILASLPATCAYSLEFDLQVWRLPFWLPRHLDGRL